MHQAACEIEPNILTELLVFPLGGEKNTFANLMGRIVDFRDLGRVDYAEAWELQTALHRQTVDRKLANRKRLKAGNASGEQRHTLLFCEHPPVFTLGKSGSADHLLLPEAALEKQGFSFFRINRGGDITYHGPGQLVAYPIFDLDEFFTDVHRYVRYLEEVVIRCLAEYGLDAGREQGLTGVWLPADAGRPKRKICAIGVHLSRWVTMHGFAFNVNTRLAHFDHIVPCGIADPDKTVTSLARELGRPVTLAEVKGKVKRHFAELFEFEYSDTDEKRYSTVKGRGGRPGHRAPG